MPKSDQAELYWNGQRIGVYNYTTKVYRRVDTDGKLSGPVPLPWAGSAKEASSREVKLRADYLAKKTHSEPESTPVPWTPYAMGGGVTGFVLMLRIVLLFARR